MNDQFSSYYYDNKPVRAIYGIKMMRQIGTVVSTVTLEITASSNHEACETAKEQLPGWRLVK